MQCSRVVAGGQGLYRAVQGIFGHKTCLAHLQEHCRLWERRDKVEDRNLVGMMRMLECDERPEAAQPEVGCVLPAACNLPVQQQCPAVSELNITAPARGHAVGTASGT